MGRKICFFHNIRQGGRLGTWSDGAKHSHVCFLLKLLAQHTRLSQSSRAMHSSGRSQNRARVVVSAVVFTAFAWTLLVSDSPLLHGRIHHDAYRVDHVCAITLIASGNYEHASQPPLISALQFELCCAAAASLTPTWLKPLFLNAHIFAHAPPAHS